MSTASQAGRRRLDSSVPPEYDVPTREPRIESPRAARVVLFGVFVAWLAGVAGAATAVVAIPGAPSSVARPAAALLTVVFTIGLTHRTGGRMRIWVPISTALVVAAVILETNALLAASAAVTAVLGSVWAVLVTRPASSVWKAVFEYAFALVVALSGTLAVAAWNATVNYQRFNLLVLTVALALAIASVWNLGAGLHGLGRQNLAVVLGVAVLLLVILAYSSFVRTHGSEVIVTFIRESVIWMRQNFEGVPRPVEVFIGFPALILGVSLRSKRREGWWILLFAVIGTGVLTTSLVTPGAYPSYVGLSTLYSVVWGLIVGLVLRRPFMRERSSRAARAIEPIVRVEPPRFAPLK